VDRRKLVVGGVTALAAGLVGTQFLQAARDTADATRSSACRALAPSPLPSSLEASDAPDFELPDGNGKKWSLRGLRGRPVLLNFWFTSCPPCAEEMPSLEELARRAGDKAVVLAVSVDESWDDVKRFFPNGTPISLLHDPSKQVPKSYGTEKFPETFLIDAAGKVRYYFIDKRDWTQGEATMCLDSLK
jgi:peroxiredoxin